MNRSVFAALFLMSSGLSLFADSNAEVMKILPAKTANALIEKGALMNSSYRKPGASLQLAPAIELVRNSENLQPVPDTAFFVENLYLYRKSEAKSGAPGNDAQSISVILRSLSRLEGIQYYSTSHRKMRTLYEKSYTVDGEKSRKRIADPIQGSADGVSILAVQKDTTFGENLYRYQYSQNTDSVAFFSSNLETMSYALFKLIDPNHLKITLVVHDLGDSLLVYGLTCADFAAIPGIEGKLNASFSTRADAIYKWFVSEYEK